MKSDATLQNLADFENKSLLIVDDDNPFRERLARAMEKKGFDVIQAEGVQKGIDTVRAKKPGFAVVDLRLGDGNGLEVVKEIQTLNSTSRIIMLTGYGNIPTAVAAIKEGAIEFKALSLITLTSGSILSVSANEYKFEGVYTSKFLLPFNRSYAGDRKCPKKLPIKIELKVEENKIKGNISFYFILLYF